MKLTFTKRAAVTNFVGNLVPHGAVGPSVAAIGVEDNGRIVAGMTFHTVDEAAGVVEACVAALPGARWATRENISVMQAYPFVELEAQMVIARIALTDTRLARMLESAGFKLIPVPRMLGRYKDGLLCLLTDHAWLSNKFSAGMRMREAA